MRPLILLLLILNVSRSRLRCCKRIVLRDERLHRETDLAATLESDKLDLHDIANLEHFVNAVDAAVCNF